MKRKGDDGDGNDVSKNKRTSLASITDTSVSHKSVVEMLQMADDDPDIVFLSSSLNNMLVSGILKGINLSIIRASEERKKASMASQECITR